MRVGCQIGVWGAASVEAAIAEMGAAKLKGIELFHAHIVSYYSTPAVLRDCLKKAGMSLAGVYFASDKFIAPDGECEVLDQVKEACDFIRSVEGGFLVMNGGVGKPEGRTFSDDEFDRMARIANRIGVESRQRDVQTVIHPHIRCMIESCGDVDRLLDAGLNKNLVGLCVHASHQHALGLDPYEMYEKHASWVRYVHVGNTGKDGKGELLGEGALDQNRLHKPILNAGFDGWFIIECRKEGMSAKDYCNDARKFMKSQWRNVRWE